MTLTPVSCDLVANWESYCEKVCAGSLPPVSRDLVANGESYFDEIGILDVVIFVIMNCFDYSPNSSLSMKCHHL